MNGPLSPEELAAQASYWGGADVSSPAAAPPPVDASAYYGPPPAPVDAGPMYDYSSGPAPEPVPPPAPIRPVGAQLSQVGDPQTGGFHGTSPPELPVTDLGDIDVPPAADAAVAGPAVSFRIPAGAPRTAGGAPPAPVSHGGSGPRGPSEYERATRGLRGTFDEDKAAMQRGATAEEDRSQLIAEGGQDIARQKQDDEMMQRLEAANAAKTFGDYQAETQRQIDDVRSKTINPNRAYADSGSAVTAVIGGLLGGIYQGINKLSSNPFLDQMNKTIDRDIAAQETDLRTKKEAIGERKGLLADMRATYKDEALAKIQARNLYYEAAKEELAARASTYDSPAIQARADQAISAINREQSKLDINEAIRKAAAAQAAGAAAEHRRQQDFENRLKLQDMRNKTTTADAGAAKDFAEGGKKEAGDVARFVGTGKDAAGNPIGYLERNAEGAKEREDARIAATALLKKIDRAQEIRNGQGTLGRTLNRQDPDQAIQLYTPEWQTQVRHLRSEMTTDWAHAKKLGALSDSDRKLADDAIGDLESRGSTTDERLNELRRTLQASLDAETEAASGPRATKKLDAATGRERLEFQGGSNAPTNQRTVRREPVK